MAQRPLIGVLTNPNSKKNRANPKRYDMLKRTVGDLGLVRRTQGTGEIADVVREFLDSGVVYWLADGGDGAFHWLLNTLWQVRSERGETGPLPHLMPTNAGTIDFIGRKAEVEGDCDSLLHALTRQLLDGRTPEIGHIGTLLASGVHAADSDFPNKPFERLGFAASLAGVGQRFFGKWYAHDNHTPLGIMQVVGKILGSAITRAPMLEKMPVPDSYRGYSTDVFEPMPLDVYVDGKLLPIREFRSVDVGAIDINLAGVFRFFPLAREPGILHVQAGNPTVLEVVRNLPLMASGQPLAIKNYFQSPALHLRVVTRDGCKLDPDIDGELFWGISELEVVSGPLISVVKLQAR